MREELFNIYTSEIKMDQLFPTGFTIELSKGKYFKRWSDKTIQCSNLAGASYFKAMKEAEDFIYTSLNFVGLDPYICRVGWVLEHNEHNMYWGKDSYTPNSCEAQWFLSYSEAALAQTQYLKETSIIEYHSYRVKKIVLAA